MASRVVGRVGVTAAIIYSASFLHKATCARISPSKNRNLSKILLITDECVPTTESACVRAATRLYPAAFRKEKRNSIPRPYPEFSARNKSGTVSGPSFYPVNSFMGTFREGCRGLTWLSNPFERL